MIPEIKIILYLVFVVSLFFFKNLQLYLILLFIASLFLLRIPFRKIIAGWLPIGLFLIFTFVSNMLNQHGKILYSYSLIVITQEGLSIAAVRTARLLLMIAGVKILMGFSKTEDIIQALGRLLSPFERLGLPVRDFFHTVGLTLQCFPALTSAAYQTYRERISTDGVQGFREKARMVSVFLFPLFSRSMQSPEEFFRKSGDNGEEK